MSAAATTILKALDDSRLFGQVLRDRATWAAWRCFLAAFFGLPMSDPEAETFRACTARAGLPCGPFAEGWLVCGRRSGKSFVMALVAVFLAAFKDYRRFLGPGERATIMIIAADRKQARVVMRYIRGLLAIPALAKLVETDRTESIDLARQVTIEVQTASFRSVRGYSIAAALLDEVAFWPSDDTAANPDVEILAALRPAMATIPNAVLLCASSPYARHGALWETFKRFHGTDDPAVLVWKAPTLIMNPTVPRRVIDEALERDPASAAAEYFAEFRTDVEAFVKLDVIESAVDPEITARPPRPGVVYFGYVDAASGAGKDSFAAAISHREEDLIILDALYELRPPFNPQSAIVDVAALLKSYHLPLCTGDKYSAGFVIEAFARAGVTYRYCENDTSQNYLEALPLFSSGRVRLLDNKRLVSQFAGLERRTSTAGRDRVDHGVGDRHDDLSAACAGALAAANSHRNQKIPLVMPYVYSRSNSIPGGAYADLRNPAASDFPWAR